MKYIIVDIDGTISDSTHRQHFIDRAAYAGRMIQFQANANLDTWKPNWDTFYKAAKDDPPIQDVIDLLRNTARGSLTGIEFIFITERDDRIYQDTRDWLEKHGFKTPLIYMRKHGDHRPDYLVKAELFEEFKREAKLELPDEPIEVVGVFEDRKQVVDMWRWHGLRVYQVAEGNF